MIFPNPRRIREAFLPMTGTGNAGIAMIIELRTKRRWIVSVLEAVSESQDVRVVARATIRQSSTRTMVPGQKGFAMRLKSATRPLADAAR
jgi:hypothetical protein